MGGGGGKLQEGAVRKVGGGGKSRGKRGSLGWEGGEG